MFDLQPGSETKHFSLRTLRVIPHPSRYFVESARGKHPNFNNGKGVIELFGYEIREMLVEAVDKYGGDNAVKEKLSDDDNEEKSVGRITILSSKSVFDNGGMVEDDGLQDEGVYLDFDDDPEADVDQELDKRTTHAAKNGLSKAGVKRLRKSVERHKAMSKIGLESGGPAKVPSMKLQLENIKQSVSVKVRRYTVLQQSFLDKYIEQLLKLGF